MQGELEIGLEISAPVEQILDHRRGFGVEALDRQSCYQAAGGLKPL